MPGSLKPDISTINSEACAWIAQLDGGNVSPRDLQVFKEWIRRSPAHEAAIKQAVSIWSDMNSLTELMEPIEQAHLTERNLVTKRPIPIWQPALATLLVVGFVWFGMTRLSAPATSSSPASPLQMAEVKPLTFTTQIGETRTETMADGSQISLNTNTEIEVKYEATQRHIRLIRGEALFDVMPDKNRPFTVYAGDGFVRAVGTVFAVELDLSNSLTVVVTEGAVELAALDTEQGSWPNAETEPKPIARPTGFVKSGHKAHLTKNETKIKPVPMAELQTNLSWKEGLLVFSGEPLSKVVMQMSRYTTQKITISDEATGNIPVGGVFPAGDIDAFLEAAEHGMNLQIIRPAADEIILAPKSKD